MFFNPWFLFVIVKNYVLANASMSMIFVIFEGKAALAFRLNGLSLANKCTRILKSRSLVFKELPIASDVSAPIAFFQHI